MIFLPPQIPQLPSKPEGSTSDSSQIRENFLLELERPGEVTPRPWFPPRLKMTGISLPALTTLSIGSLSTGAKKPVNGYRTT
jgi:hypothetical protein